MSVAISTKIDLSTNGLGQLCIAFIDEKTLKIPMWPFDESKGYNILILELASNWQGALISTTAQVWVGWKNIWPKIYIYKSVYCTLAPPYKYLMTYASLTILQLMRKLVHISAVVTLHISRKVPKRYVAGTQVSYTISNCLGADDQQTTVVWRTRGEMI